MDEDGSELIWCDECFMEIPYEDVFQSICWCWLGCSVSGQSWIDVESVVFWWERKGRMRCIWRYVNINSDRYKS